MKLPTEIKCIVFDLDGVLWDTNFIHEIAYKKALENYNLKSPSYVNIAGRKTREVIIQILNQQRVDDKNNTALIDEITQLKQEIAHNLITQSPPINSNCSKHIMRLSKCYSLGLATSSSKRNVDIFIKHTNTMQYFKIVVSGDEIQHCKPNPLIYTYSTNLLGYNPDQVAVVEDSSDGIIAAKAAGIKIIVGVEGLLGRKKLLELGATDTLTNIGELS